MVVFTAPGRGDVSVVASRKVGNAVKRNRAKRILRSAWRESTGSAPTGIDVVLVAREGIRGMRTQDLVAEMIELVRSGVGA
jgi:ribonuclease P protein component